VWFDSAFETGKVSPFDLLPDNGLSYSPRSDAHFLTTENPFLYPRSCFFTVDFLPLLSPSSFSRDTRCPPQPIDFSSPLVRSSLFRRNPSRPLPSNGDLPNSSFCSPLEIDLPRPHLFPDKKASIPGWGVASSSKQDPLRELSNVSLFFDEECLLFVPGLFFD